MDGTNVLSDAEMRLITVNGQTIMLEGDFENINMTNEFLNEMLMVSDSEVDISDRCSVEINENSCVNGVKGSDEPQKLEISIQGDNNELETVQIGVEEAKALGLYFYGCKDDENNSWNCTLSGNQEETVKDEEKVSGNSEGETCKVKLHSVPVVSVGCLDREPETLLFVNEVTKLSETCGTNADSFPFSATARAEKIGKPIQEENTENLPAIGHLEGFQIPTSEDGLLLPTTVNAKMVDGSYQTITLVPQIANGAVTYTVHFSNLSREIMDKNLNNLTSMKESETFSNVENSVNKEIINNEINSVEEFLSSVQSIKNNQAKKFCQGNMQRHSDNKISVTGFVNSLTEDSVLKINQNNQSVETGKDVSVSYMHQNQLPIDAKIDNLISENENVISRCKKVKYGKKVKSMDTEPLTGTIKVTKSNITKAKKVKFKNKGFKFLSDELEQKKLKLSLLKPNNGHKLESTDKKGLETTKAVNTNLMPHMNLNGRLEYPNLKAIDETASLPYLKMKSQQATKQPYFNVLPYPKDKTIPVQKQILPLNCDLQQAKNLISLQKFLETQKLQLKIQPIVSNGNKIINIRPKPTMNEEVKVFTTDIPSKHVLNKLKEKHLSCDIPREGGIHKTQEQESAKKSYQENLNVKDVLLSDGKLNNLKFLKSHNSNSEGDDMKEFPSDCTNKLSGIFIKNNPEYFSQKFKDGKSDEHPLGSSENPIQLVQTGHTFHSRQPLSETQLRQIASILQKQKFDSPNVKKNSIFDPKTNTRIVYRVVYPEDVELKDTDKSCADGITKRKRGRHKNKPSLGDEEIQKKPSPLPRGPGRPKKTPTSVLEEDVLEEEIEDTTPKKKIPRTRSGRLSRPPRYMIKDYKRLHNSENTEKNSNTNYESNEIYPAYQNGKKIPLDRTESIPDVELETNLLPGLRPQQRSKRNFKPEYRCPTCQKIYLGHTRMMWHLNKFPDHCNVEKYKENYYRKRSETKVRRAARRLNMCDVTNKVKQVLNAMSKDELISFCGPLLADALTTWDFLLLRVNLLKDNKKDEVDALLHELILLLEKLTKIAEDIFLPVFSKEAEKDDDCIEIDRMEVAIALGLPVGFYKINNDNLNLLKPPLKNCDQGSKENTETEKNEKPKVDSEELFPESQDQEKQQTPLFHDKEDLWEGDKTEKKLEENSFWLENKVEDSDAWHHSQDSMKTLATKFEPNLSSKLLESSNDSIDDGKYEGPVQLIDLDSNSKDVEQSNSSENLDGSPNMVKDHGKMPDISRKHPSEEKSSLWNENSADKESAELWNENSEREKWDETSGIVRTKSTSELWTTDNSDMPTPNEKPASNLWNENSNLTGSEKVDDTNSEFLDSLLSVPNSNEFLANESGNFLSENITLMNDKNEELKSNESVRESKEKNEWRNDGDDNNYMRVWDTGKNPSWPKEESILSGGLQDRMPGVRTTGRLTSTPETNGNMSFSISNRRNSISDFSNINLESANLDMVLPSAKTLIKDCLKNDEGKFEMKEGSFLEGSDNYKVKNWGEGSEKPDFSSANVNSEDLMKMALESLTSQHDVINVPATSFDSAIGILNQNQESGNLNLFTTSETDGLDFNLPLPDHLLRTNFASSNFQTGCEQHSTNNFQNSDSPTFLSTTSNIFGTTCTLSNSIKFDQFDTNFTNKKSKSLDDVIEFFDSKTSFNGYEGGGGGSPNINNFPFGSDPTHGDGYSVPETLVASEDQSKKKKSRSKKPIQKRSQKMLKKIKNKKTASMDYPKTKTIESIINEALFESCASTGKPLQMQDSSPNGNSTIQNASENYSLPIISGSLDEVENLDFLSQD